ncbi:hypothetical protein QR680_018894 [Steinernema hermaphroditum]|uniref:Uncharacterized protein n=1 Tax=Steinernema hermaphroditum TaxID=289476 RepID=A0AA39HLL5_9BILA|nr:hypothetical protein QR680_018894 [Steinernema hermaphroditum]
MPTFNSTVPTTSRRSKIPSLQCHFEKPSRAIVRHFGGDDFAEADPEECDGGFCIKYAHREGTARGCSQVGIGLTVSGYCKNMV